MLSRDLSGPRHWSPRLRQAAALLSGCVVPLTKPILDFPNEKEVLGLPTGLGVEAMLISAPATPRPPDPIIRIQDSGIDHELQPKVDQGVVETGAVQNVLVR